jgi:hypothetical protein
MRMTSRFLRQSALLMGALLDVRAGLGTLGGLGWIRAFLLALAAGPLFGGIVNVAMLYAPLSPLWCPLFRCLEAW